MSWINIINYILAGIFATAIIDISGILLNKIFGLPKTEWRFIGRWVFYMKDMKFTHGMNNGHISRYSIAKNELLIGWIFHYMVGVLFSVIYFIGETKLLGYVPNIVSATIFGIFTLVAPWFIMSPCLGNGVFFKKHPRKKLMRILSTLSHITFGQSLYLWWYITKI